MYWEGPAPGNLASTEMTDWTFCIQCSKSLQVLSVRSSANCYDQELGENQAYRWMPEPYHQHRITMPDSAAAMNGIWGTGTPVHTRTHRLGFPYLLA